jgi:hypothetical protein
MVISADPEVNRFIFQQEGKLFRSWYPETANIIIGKKTIDEFSGAAQKCIRTFISRLFGLEYLKQELLPELENYMRDSFAEWATKPSIDAHEGATNVSELYLLAMHFSMCIYYIFCDQLTSKYVCFTKRSL